ncbi:MULTISPECIES: AbrB family transcriptional regulator [Rhodomicrobium]|uniref:AbrB family transcriptional regulator n=1 Tax=Rhodomicrobium TaxID=1068 RepID=UPI000B4B3F65|nr:MULTISPECIES: AbrB family transcriptional regulator [Rhodomicrobium]
MISWEKARHVAFTLAAGVAGSLSLHALGTPAAWLTGSMLTVSALALAGLPVYMPVIVRQVVFLMLGVSIGSGFTPAIMENVARWPISIGILGVTVVFVILGSAAFLILYGKWSRATALFASVPGALSYVVAMSLRSSADTRLVVVAQMLRIVALLAVLPSLITLSVAADRLPVPQVSGYLGVLVEAAVGGVIGYLLEKRNFPAGMLFGGMVSGAILHLSGGLVGSMPPGFLIPCQLLLGCTIGVRFIGTRISFLLQAFVPSMGSFLIALLISAVGAVVVASTLGLPFGQVIVAFAPGGIEAMTILAFVLGLDPAFVATHQLVRFLGLSLLLPVIVKYYLRDPAI